MAERSRTEKQKSVERALEDAVSRALRDNLAPLQRTTEELQQAYADLIAACTSTRPANALPAMLRAQTAASALAAGLAVLSNFVTLALNPRDRHASAEEAEPADVATETADGAHRAFPATSAAAEESEWAEEPIVARAATERVELTPEPAEAGAEEAAAEARPFDLESLPPEVQDLHRRANRVAKVAMQDIQLLRPKDVRLGREHKDICHRLRTELDKARKEYDRRFRPILDDPIDYFHHWMVEILAGGNPEALGEYPYPSPVLRH